jgi:eukaryotic-like serine/threonine-protein kinase
VNPSLPVALSKVIRRSLAKDPSRRYQSAIDLRNDVEDLKQEIDSGIAPSAISQMAPVERRRSPLRLVSVIGTVLMIVGVLALAYSYFSGRGVSTSDFVAIDRPARLTNSGNAALAAISPDGKYVAHVKNEPGATSLWMRQTATASDVQIVPPIPVHYDGVTYSPDGNHVYFVTYPFSAGVGTLYRVPALGGTPEKILEDVDSRISFSPDRTQFTFTRGVPVEGTAFVMVANADGANPRRLAQLKTPEQFLLNGPTWSSDGRTIMATGQSLGGGPHAIIVAIDVATGEMTTLKDRWNAVADLEWVSGTKTFMAVAAEFGQAGPQLWQIGYPSGERHRITNDLNTYASLSLSADRASLATVQTEAVANLWIGDANKPADELKQITQGRGRGDGLNGMDWTPDHRLVFVSSAIAGQQLWIADAEGRDVRQLTAAPQEPVFSASVTPDGRYVVFQRFADGRMRVWRMNLDGSDQKPLTDGTLDLSPVAAPDGVVYFNRPTDGLPRAFKVPIDGGTPVSLGDQLFRPVDVSPDGSLLLGVSWDTNERRSVLATMPATGGAPTHLTKIPAFVGSLSADGKGVFYPVLERTGFRIERYDLASGTTSTLNRLSGVVFRGATSPDGKYVALSRGNILSDVLLLGMKPVGSAQ